MTGEEPSEVAAALLDGHPDYRVLRRLRPSRQVGGGLVGRCVTSAVALDCETTGLSGEDVIIELAMTPFIADAEGRIMEVGRPRRWLEDPGRPVASEITRLTGLTDVDLRGRTLADGEATCLLLSSDVVVAHNASFDRGFVERRLPLAGGRPWVCSMRDVDWRAAGYEGSSLQHLLMQMGVFYSAHRADVDVAALIRLMQQIMPSGSTAFAEALARGSARTFAVTAAGAPFAAKEMLKARRYRWLPNARAWSTEVNEPDVERELAWLRAEVYGGAGSPLVEPLDWTTRYRR